MSDHEKDAEVWLETVRVTYHVPGDAPREEMWRVISGAISEEPSRQDVGTDERSGADVIDLGARRRNHVRFGFLTAAAAALVVLGFGLGRLGGPAPDVPTPPTAAVQEPSAGLRVAAEEHLGRSESLLTMVRADAREGALDPVTAEWSRALLTQTRLLIDMQADGDPTVLELLEDLELVLVQIVGVAESGASDDDLARTELELAIRGLEEGAVLPRIQAALPSYAGA